MSQDLDLTKELNAINEGQQNKLAESLKEINDLANTAYAAKLTATNYENISKELKGQLAGLMETAGVDKISATDCSVSGKMKASASVPKGTGEKIDLFKYIAALDNLDGNGKPVVSHGISELMGELCRYPTLFSMLTINAASFNSWYASEQESQILQGNEAWELPFISTYEYYSIGFRKKAKK